MIDADYIIKTAIEIGIKQNCLPNKFTLSKRGRDDLVKIIDELMGSTQDIKTVSGVAMGYCSGFYIGVTEAGNVGTEENGE